MRKRLVAFVILAAPSFGFAQSSTADPTYKEALKLENSGNFAAALDKFASIPEGQRLFATRMHVAGCKSKLGRMHEAEAELVALLSDPKLDEAERETAKGQLAFLRERMPKLSIKIADALAGAIVTLDGTVVTPPTTSSVDPGIHRVVATKDGTESYRRDVTLEEGQAVTVQIDAPTTIAPATVKTPSPPETTTKNANPIADDASMAAPHDSSGRRTLALVVAGVGVVSVGVGGYFWARMNSLRKESDDLAAVGNPDAFARADDARTAQRWARIGMATGVVAVGIGAVLFFTAPSGDGAKASTSGVRILPSAASVWGLSLEGAW